MIIAADRQIPRVAEACLRLGEVRFFDSSKPSEVLGAVADADALLCRSTIRVDANLLQGTSVRFVGTATSGMDHVDIDWLSQRGIAFSTAAGSNSRSVAEYVVVSLLEVATRLGRQLHGMTVGIIGAGHVGSAVAQMTSALGMEIRLNDPPLAERGDRRNFASLDETLACDVVSIHVPLTITGVHRTLNLLDESRLKRLHRDAILVQTSRGGVIDEQALNALRARGHLGGTIMDVFIEEPNINPETVGFATLATPHIAGHSWDGKIRGTDMIVRSLFGHSGRLGEWTALDMMHSTSLMSDADFESDEATRLLNLLRRVYDVQIDDDAIRASCLQERQHVPEWFTSYRKRYRRRREFPHYTVDVSTVGEELSKTLANLGFCIHHSCWNTRSAHE